ncbi:MAG: hypothetical protein GY835_13770 [bacterium]|nr:hypothetical protein [bacterium]
MTTRLNVIIGIAGLPLLLLLVGFTLPWNADGPWPASSSAPVTTLDFVTFESMANDLDRYDSLNYSFAVFGDQRALADGEWQAIVAQIADLSAADPNLRFVIDTGDIVNAGKHADQWRLLQTILSPLSQLPYLVTVGNHELGNNASPLARSNTATCLAYLDTDFGTERMYYRKDLGPVRYLFLDSNDLIYGEAGTGGAGRPAPGGRAEAQMIWLAEQLAEDDDTRTTVVMLHHPLVQSSRKHLDSAAAIWSYSWRGRSLPDILADGGVDVVLTGHTHTYERYRLLRDDGREMCLVNISGRPRDSFLWFGKRQRKARDIAGREIEYLTEHGWRNLTGWRIEQQDAMISGHKNNFAIIRVDAEGNLDLEMHYLDEDELDGLRSVAPVRIHSCP